MIIRPAKMADIERFTDHSPKPTVRAWVGEEDGEILGVAGFALIYGRWFGFCDITAEGRKHKIAVLRAARRAMEEFKATTNARYIYVNVDRDEENSVKWLTSLGFKRWHRGNPDSFRWRK